MHDPEAPPPTPEELRTLIELARGGTPLAERPVHRFSVESLIRQWAATHGFLPGPRPTGRSGDLYQHFLEWSYGQLGRSPALPYGGRMPEGKVILHTWGRTLRQLGFQLASAWFPDIGPRKVFLMDAGSAKLLRTWLRERGISAASEPRTQLWRPKRVDGLHPDPDEPSET